MKQSSKIKDETLVAANLRLPSYLKTWLENSAAKQERSLNGEIILILKEYYAVNNKN